MTTYQFVTTFSPAGYHCYGQRFVDSFVERSEFPLVVYHESQDNVDFHRLLTWRNLDHDEDRKRFIQEHGSDPVKVATEASPNSQSIRFCHKVFAITDAILRREADWVIWMDADTEITGRITPELMARVCPEGSDLSFLHRIDMPYTECGFVGYRAASARVIRLAEDMRQVYTSGELFTWNRHEWHDSRTFDRCRMRSQIPVDRQFNLCQFARGGHVWPHSLLAEFSVHHKGPARKNRAYGSHCK